MKLRGKRTICLKSLLLRLFFRGTAYFNNEGERREYAPEDSDVFDIIFKDKMQIVYDLEQKEKEELEMQRLTNAIQAFHFVSKSPKKKISLEPIHSTKATVLPKCLIEACSEEDRTVTHLN